MPQPRSALSTPMVRRFHSLLHTVLPVARYIAGQIPLLGDLPFLRTDRLDMVVRLGRQCRERGVAVVRFGPQMVTMLTDPDAIHGVLVEQAECFEKGPALRTFTRPVLGEGLLTSLNTLHKRQRKLVAPAFQHRRIMDYATIMAEYAERSVAEWTDGATVDIAREMMRLTLEIAGKTLFDSDVRGEADDLGRALTVAMRYATDEMRSTLHIPLTWPTPRNRRVLAAIARLNTTIYRLIEHRRSAGDDRGDFLSMLLLAQDDDGSGGMSDEQVRDEAMTIFLAGHETTANALTWSWYLLTQHPAIYSRLQAEVDSALAGRSPTVADLPRLPYTLQVLKEAMRLYPPAYVVLRQATQPVDLGICRVPAGSLVMISPYVMHHRPDFFPDPDRFDPDRFAPEAEKRLPRYAYMPFSNGPRVCIGNHFALLEGHIVLATLAQRVSFTAISRKHPETEPLITLRPRNGIPLTVHSGNTSGA